MPREVAVELSYSSTWNDLVTDERVFSDEPITITRGGSLESLAPKPATLICKLNNYDDLLRVSNPMSPLYGVAGRNTPLRCTVDNSVRGYFQVSNYDSGYSRDYSISPPRGKAWTSVESGGLIQQINQWKDPLNSPIVRQTLSISDLMDFWPLDDTNGATVLSSAVTGGTAARYTAEVSTGSDDKPIGASAAIIVSTSGTVRGTFKKVSGNGYRLVFGAKVVATLSATYQEIFTWVDSVNRKWTWEVNNANYGWSVYDADGVLISNQTQSYSSTSQNQWIWHQIIISVSGGTLSYDAFWWPQGGTGSGGVTKTFAATVAGVPRRWNIPSNAYTLEAGYSSLYTVNSTGPDGPDETYAFDAFVGEKAGWRFARLMTEIGLDWSHIGDPETSREMGPQIPTTLSDLFKEIADTEDGLIYDDRTTLRILMMMRSARYNQTATTVYVTDLLLLPPESVGDRGIRNIVTVQNSSGGFVIDEDTTSPLSSQLSPDGVGPYEYTLNVNVENSLALPELARWTLRKGTIDEPRYNTVTVKMDQLTVSRREEIAALDVGDVIEIPDYRENKIRLWIVGYTEVVGWPKSWTITFLCLPNKLFDTGVYGSTLSRYGTKTATLAEDLDITETSIDITAVARGDCFGSRDLPYGVMVGGELIVVTAVGAISGTGPYAQTITGTRGCNGIFKPHSTGAPLQVETPGRYAL